jgi:ankyrin repeat protein
MKETINSLVSAARSGNMKMVDAVLKTTPQAAEHWQPIMTAAFEGHVEIVKTLLEHGANANVVSKNNYRHRPLHRVLEHKKTIPKGKGHLETVRVLLESGASLTARGGHSQMSPVCLAAVGGETQFIPILLEHLDTWDIFTASALGEFDRAKDLLDKSPDLVETLDVNRWRPMNYCCGSRVGCENPSKADQIIAIVKMLRERGAAIDKPPHPLASAVGKLPIMALLLKLGANPNHGIINAAWSNDFKSVELLLDAGADMSRRVVDDTVSELVQFGMYRMAELFVERGANVNGTDNHQGRTMLHWAALRGANLKFVGFLLDLGADCSVTDHDGATPLQLAKLRERKKLAEFLEDYDRSS